MQRYLEHLPDLVEEFPLDVALAYVFSRVELSHNMALYCGVVKLHKAEASLAYRAIQKEHITREGFRSKFEVVYGACIPDDVTRYLVLAEGVRDRVIHGKEASDSQKRNAIAHVITYATVFNKFAT